MALFRRFLPILLLALLTGCEFVYEVLEIPDPKKQAAEHEAESRAIGGACRHAGRSLEDCFVLNPGADKAAVFSGWREMNDYMMMNEMEVVPSRLPQPGEQALRPPAPALRSAPVDIIEPPETIVPMLPPVSD